MQVLIPKQDLLNSIDCKFHVGKCKFGKGLFAKKDIRKGEMILEFIGDLINFEQTLTNYQGDPLQVDKNLYISLQQPVRFVNHCCEPNAGIKNDVFLVALEDICQGAEIYFDYSTSMDEDHWVMVCECGSVNCRQIVKDFKYLPPQVKQKYLELEIVQRFIATQHQPVSANTMSVI